MRKWIAVLIALCVAAGCIACSAGRNSSASYSSDDYYYEPTAMSDEYYESAKTASGAASRNELVAEESETVPQESGRKLIRDASLTIESKNFDEIMPQFEQQIKAHGGYLESMNESGNSYRSSSYRSAYLVARIPSDNLDAFLSVADGLGNVTQKTLSTRDVTSTYVDIESRLKVLETEKESLQNIMASASTTEEMLATQSRLYDVIEEIEAYEAQKRTFDSLISYSTVSISVKEVVELTPAKEETRGEELARRFKSSIENLGEALVDFGIGFIVAAPWLLVIGAIGGIIAVAFILPIRASKKKRRQKKEVEQKNS